MFRQPLLLSRQMGNIQPSVTCKIPLCDVVECQCKKCEDTSCKRRRYHVPQRNYLETSDPYWAEFLKAQQASAANYLYQLQIYGNNQDPTLLRKDPLPPEIVHQRLWHMPVVGSLEKDDIYYILTFILNLLQLKLEKQKEYLQLFHDQGLLDNEILRYMQIIARHPNSGIPPRMQQSFLELTQNHISRNNFFNPDRIFMKSMFEMDPYELAYLKNIMETSRNLDTYQYMYLVEFVERLQEMPVSRRDEYLKALYDREVLPSNSFPYLLLYVNKKSRKFNRKKIIALVNTLFSVMNINLCFPPPIIHPSKSRERVTEIDIDALKVNKSLKHLMKGGIPNIIRLMDLKKFVLDIMTLNAEQLEQVLNQLKNKLVISLPQFKFLETFVQKHIKGREEEKKLLLKIMHKVSSTPLSSTPTVVLAIPPIQGPIRQSPPADTDKTNPKA